MRSPSRSLPEGPPASGFGRTAAGGRRHAPPGRGFTILEVLLAIGLSVVLLGALWGLFTIYTDLFETGQAKAETAQLARSLLSQVADDLRSAIQDPIGGPSGPRPGSAPLRRFGLAGTAQQLRVDILQVTPLRGNRRAVGEGRGVADEADQPARVPELRTVYYSLAPATENASSGPAGLVRRELDFETPAPPDGDADRGALADAAAWPPGPGGVDRGGSSEPAGEDQPAGESVVWVPEVTRLEFRYFDGTGWTSQWDSLSRKSLPAAVEVVIGLQPAGTPAEPAQPAVETGLLEDELSPSSAAASGPAGEVYRMVVDLPVSPAYRKPKPPPTRARAVPVPRPVPVPIRRIAPPRAPSPQKPARLPEEWIRTRSS